MSVLKEIPEGFVARDMTKPNDDRTYYPPEITDTTLVDVIICHDGKSTLHTSKQAQCFGWMIEPAMPSIAGMSPCGAPITHYRILS